MSKIYHDGTIQKVTAFQAVADTENVSEGQWLLTMDWLIDGGIEGTNCFSYEDWTEAEVLGFLDFLNSGKVAVAIEFDEDLYDESGEALEFWFVRKG